MKEVAIVLLFVTLAHSEWNDYNLKLKSEKRAKLKAFYREAYYTEQPDVCEGDQECDGLRVCSNGKCTGFSRSNPKNQTYNGFETQGDDCYEQYIDSRKITVLVDYLCDGIRHCKANKCKGLARHPKDVTYLYQEDAEGNCPKDYVWKHYYCDGERTCVDGKCQGKARPPKDVFYEREEDG